MLCLAADASPDPMDKFIASFEQQMLTVDWVMDNSHTKMKEVTARTIVRNAYVYAYVNGLDPFLVLAVIKQESSFKTRAKSVVGAKGLMQVFPKWHQDKLGGRDPYNQQVSIEVGTQILKDCFTRFPNNKKRSFACYSGGAKNYHVKVSKYQREIRLYVTEALKTRDILMASR